MEIQTITKSKKYRSHLLKTLDIARMSKNNCFERITRIAKKLFDVEASLLTFHYEGQSFFSGTDPYESIISLQEMTASLKALEVSNLFITADASKDQTLQNHSLVKNRPHLRFYAEFRLTLGQELGIGTLCIFDNKSKNISEEECQLFIDLGKIIEHEIKTEQLATRDELTKLSNRRGFLTLAEHTLKVCKRKKLNSSIILLDLNKFKSINDQFGHSEGDYALQTIAAVLLETFRDSDIVGRWGGDEFVIFLTGTGQEFVRFSLSRLNKNLQKINSKRNKAYQIEFSSGVSHHRYDCLTTLEERIEKADAQMYQEKKLN